MMSSEETSSPVSASTFMYLMRWPVLRLIWLTMIFSASEVAGNNAPGQGTREERKKPFQLARGAMVYSRHNRVQPEILSFRNNWTKMVKVNCSAMVNDVAAFALAVPRQHNIMIFD